MAEPDHVGETEAVHLPSSDNTHNASTNKKNKATEKEKGNLAINNMDYPQTFPASLYWRNCQFEKDIPWPEVETIMERFISARSGSYLTFRTFQQIMRTTLTKGKHC